MSGAIPTTAAEDPPPLGNGESAASDKNTAEKFGSEESREVAVTSCDANVVKSGCENGTECVADEGANIVETDDANEANSGSANVVGAVDVKMADTQHEATIEAVDVKMIERQREATIEAVDVKMVETQREANIEAVDVKIVQTQCEASVEALDAKMVETQCEAIIEAVDVKMVETQRRQREANIEAVDVKMVETQCEASIEAVDVKMVETQREANIEAVDVKLVETQHEASIEAVDVKMVETQHEANIEAVDVKMAETKHEAIIEAVDVKIAETKLEAIIEAEDVTMVVAKTDAGSAEVEGNENKEDKAGQIEEKKNNASIDTEELKVPDEEYACEEEDTSLKNDDIQDCKAADGEEMKSVEGKSDAEIAEVIESRKNGELEFKAEQKKNYANIDAENVIMVDKGNACQTEDKVRKNDDSQDTNPAECEDIKTVEAKSDAGNAAVRENETNEIKEEHNEDKENVVSVQADDVKIVDMEDACRKEDTERKTEDSHGAKAAEGGGIMMAESKSAAAHAEIKENGQKEKDGNKTEEKQIVCMEKQDEDKMEPAGVDKIELDNREQIGVEMQAELKEEEKGGFDKHEVSDREESVEESQQDLKGLAKGNVGKLEGDDREQNTKEKQEGLEEVGVPSSKDVAAKNEREGAAEEQEGDKWGRKVSAEKKHEEKQDAKLTAEDKTHDGKVAAEKQEEEEVNENVTSEKNEVGVIKSGLSEKGEEMEAKGNTTGDKQEGKKDDQIDDICKHEGQNKGTKRSNADIEVSENGSVSKKEKDGEVTVEQAGESNKNVEENKTGEPKRKKARTEKDHGKDKKQDGSKSSEAKNLLSTPSPYSLDRPVRARKMVERLVEVIEKDPGGIFVVEKGRGTPLKNIPGVAKRISNKQPAELKLLHQILFGRLGKAVDFKSHILEFSGFVWHGSDEKHRTKAKEKLDKCSIETLLDLSKLLVVPFSSVNSRKDDIVAKLLDFIAEPHAKDDSTLSDDQGSNSRKRKREVGSATKNPEGTHKRSRKKLDDEYTSCKKSQKYSESESDEYAEEGHEEDDHMKSDNEENNDDGEEVDREQEDRYGRQKVKAGKKSVDGKGSTTKTKRKADTGISHKKSQKYSESESDEDTEEGHEEDDHMKSDSEENKDDGEEFDSEQEDRYGRRKVKAGKKSVDGKRSTTKTKRKADTGISPKTAPVATLSKCSSRVPSSLKSSKDKQRSAEDPNVVSTKSKPVTPKCTANSEKETDERRLSGKGSASKGKSAEAEQALPSKDELQKTVVQILKKVDFENVTFSDIYKMLGKHYKMDISSMKDTVKSLVFDVLVKYAEADED